MLRTRLTRGCLGNLAQREWSTSVASKARTYIGNHEKQRLETKKMMKNSRRTISWNYAGER